MFERLTGIKKFSRLCGPNPQCQCPNCGKRDVWIVDPPMNKGDEFFLVCADCNATSGCTDGMRQAENLWLYASNKVNVQRD